SRANRSTRGTVTTTTPIRASTTRGPASPTSGPTVFRVTRPRPSATGRTSTRACNPGFRATAKGWFVRQQRAGYTLFELVLVLVILVILATLAVPSFQSATSAMRLTESADILRT